MEGTAFFTESSRIVWNRDTWAYFCSVWWGESDAFLEPRQEIIPCIAIVAHDICPPLESPFGATGT